MKIYCENCLEEVWPDVEKDGDGNAMFRRTFYHLICPECGEILKTDVAVSTHL